MEQEKILLQIETELVTLRTFIRKLKPDAKIHQLDIDLLKQKAMSIYDSMLMLEPTREATPKATVFDIKKPEPAKVPEHEIDNSMELEKQRLIKNIQAIKAETIMTSEEEISHPEEKPIPPVTEKEEKSVLKQKPDEESKPETVEFDIEQPVEKPAEEKQPTKKLKPETPKQSSLNEKPKETAPEQVDLFTTSPETLADKLSSEKQKTVADKLSHNQQNTLRQFIGINEKFLLINELFNGDLSKYNNAIDELDSMQTPEGANTYLFELQVQYQWEEDSDAYLKIKELLEKKFL